MFRVTVTELIPGVQSAIGPDMTPGREVERYTQTVDAIDLPQIIAAVNRKPRKPRERKAKE